jgi:hypothetical protein
LGSNKFRVTGSDAAKVFFTCTDVNCKSPSALWYIKLRSKIKKAIFTRAVKNGDNIDNSQRKF